MYIVALVLFVAGMWLTGFGYSLDEWQGVVFTAGILAIAAALAIPVHLAQRR